MSNGLSAGAGPSTQSPQTPSYPWIDHYPEGVAWDMPINPQPLPTVLQEAARTFANHSAISFMGKVTTYTQLDSLVNRVAAGLQQIGVTKGTKVGLFLPNTPTFIVYYYAILRAGGTVVNFNPLYTLEELSFQVRDSQTEIMVTHDLDTLFALSTRVAVLADRHVITSGTAQQVAQFDHPFIHHYFAGERGRRAMAQPPDPAAAPQEA